MTTASGPPSALGPADAAPAVAGRSGHRRAQGFGRFSIGAATVSAGTMGIALFGALASVDLLAMGRHDRRAELTELPAHVAALRCCDD